MEIRIYYEDTDCGGVVYYANYLRYFERARTEHLEKLGLSFRQLMEQDTLFVVVHAEVDYLSPSRYGETLVVETTLTDIGRASFTILYGVSERETHRKVAKGKTIVACVDGQGRVKNLGSDLREKLRGACRGHGRG
jgi:acyl-CoA thioester hydrolase